MTRTNDRVPVPVEMFRGNAIAAVDASNGLPAMLAVWRIDGGKPVLDLLVKGRTFPAIPVEFYREKAIEAVDRTTGMPGMIASWRKHDIQITLSLLTKEFPYAEMPNSVAMLRERLEEYKPAEGELPRGDSKSLPPDDFPVCVKTLTARIDEMVDEHAKKERARELAAKAEAAPACDQAAVPAVPEDEAPQDKDSSDAE